VDDDCQEWWNPFEITSGISVPRLSWAQYEGGGLQRGTVLGFDHIQSGRKVTQPIKYLFVVEIQYNMIGLISTQYHCDYTRAHAGHIML
jgi:hypothetical protein